MIVRFFVVLVGVCHLLDLNPVCGRRETCNVCNYSLVFSMCFPLNFLLVPRYERSNGGCCRVCVPFKGAPCSLTSVFYLLHASIVANSGILID